VKSDLSSAEKSATLLEMDQVLGLRLEEYIGKPLEIPSEVQKLVEEREQARADKNFTASDDIRDKINISGYDIEDTPTGPKLRKSKEQTPY
jgi:cysteinyl-tRNA synthetase